MKKRLVVSIPKKNLWLTVSCVFMGLSAAIRLWHYLPQNVAGITLWVHLATPVFAAVMFLAGVAAGGKTAKAGVIGAAVLGVTFFIIKATTFELLHQILCTILYAAVLVLFVSTLLGYLPTKKFLYPLFGLPLIYHIVVEDTQKYFFAEPPVPVWEWMPEISVLCIMAGLLCLSAALETERIK